MGFDREPTGNFAWVGALLPNDPDDWVFQVLLGCTLSRLSAFDPVDQYGDRGPDAAVEVAIGLVDQWWRVVEGGDLELDWLQQIEHSMLPFQGRRNPVGTVLGIGRQIFLSDDTRTVWEIAVKELESDLVVLGDWRERRYPRGSGQGSWSEGVFHPSPEGAEFALVRAALPMVMQLNAALDQELETVQRADALAQLPSLRANALSSGKALQTMVRTAEELKFPGPDAPFEDVLAVIATIES